MLSLGCAASTNLLEPEEVMECLQSINETFRVPLLLFYLGEQSFDEIAGILTISPEPSASIFRRTHPPWRQLHRPPGRIWAQPFQKVIRNGHKPALSSLGFDAFNFDVTGGKIDFRPIQGAKFGAPQPGEKADGNPSHHPGSCRGANRQPESSNWGIDSATG
jgi:hypothetical protein